jgi:tRNA (guanine-N7-)-methyltransferase
MNPLRKPDPSEPRPRSWKEVFGRAAPLEVDVGFGRGHFLLDRARQAQQVNVVGIEMRRKWAGAVRDRIERERLANAFVLEGEAYRLIEAWFAPGEVTRFYVLFPDPWWKRRHRKRRLVTPAFASLCASRLAPGGALCVKTDVREVAVEILGILEATPGLSNAHGPMAFGPWGEDVPHSPRERRILREGVPAYAMKFLRADA